MVSEKLKFLGWGLVGTPKGRQQSDAGANQQLKVSFDLSQEIGGCLPDARKATEFVPLYCLSRKASNYHSLAIAEYFPIFEQGQTRAGSYFGAFVQTINSMFSPDTEDLKTLLNVVRALSAYQTKRFIDNESKAYLESIDGKSFDAPIEQLSEIAEQLQALPSDLLQALKGDVLFVHCAKGKSLEVLRYLLLGNWYYRYAQIFFSENEYISQQIASKKIEQMSLEGLIQATQMTKEYQQFALEQSKTIQTMKTENSHLRHQQAELVEAKVREKEGEYHAKISSLQQKLEHIDLQRQQDQVLASLGAKVVQEVGERADKLNQTHLAKFASISPKEQDISAKLVHLNNSIVSLSQKVERLKEPEVIEQPVQLNSTRWYNIAIVFLALLSGIFFAWAVYAQLSATSYQEEVQEKVTQVQKETKQKADKEYQSKIEQLEKEKKSETDLYTNAKNRVTQLCSKINAGNNKYKDLVDLCK